MLSGFLPPGLPEHRLLPGLPPEPGPVRLLLPAPVQMPAEISVMPDSSAYLSPAVPDWKLLIWRHSVSAVPHRIY